MRTNRFWILFILICACTSANAKAARKGPSEFRFRAELKGDMAKDTLYQVRLTADVLEKCAYGCPDIRIFSPTGIEIPYVITRDVTPGTGIGTYMLKVIHYEADDESAWITMKLPDNFKPISEIEMDIDERDFKKKVTLFGSHKDENWELVAEDVIYDFSSQVALRKTKIGFPPADFTYFRLEIRQDSPIEQEGETLSFAYGDLSFNTGKISKKSLKINTIVGRTGEKQEKMVVYDKKTFTNFSITTDKKNNTILKIDAKLPMDRLVLDVGDSFYYRTVRVSACETDEKDNYRLLASGVVFSFPISGKRQSNNVLAVHSEKNNYYKIIIENGDNPALDIKVVTFKWIRRNLFLAGRNNGETYALYVGNPKVKQPKYDISAFINQNNWFKQPFETLALAEIKPYEDFAPTSDADDQEKLEKIILFAVIIVVVALLGFWLYSLLRKSPGTS